MVGDMDLDFDEMFFFASILTFFLGTTFFVFDLVLKLLARFCPSGETEREPLW